MSTKQELNRDEQEVLVALWGAAQDASGGTFGVLEESFFGGLNQWLTKNQFGGFVSQLCQKGYIVYSDGGLFTVTEKTRGIFEDQ